MPLAACSASAGPGAPDAEGSPGADDRPVTVTVSPKGEQAPAGVPVRVTAAGGRLTSVTVTDAENHRLTGKVAADGRSWVSDRKAVPGAAYTVTAATRTEGGTADSTRAAFTTAAAGKVNKVDWRPGAGTTVGVAQPISLVFDHPVKNRAEVEKQLRITTSNDTEGSWGWISDWSGKDRVDWRPRTYWKPGTKVTLNAELNGTDSGADGGWFVRDYTTAFTIGARQIVEVDLDSHRLSLVRDGETVRTIPVSGGTPGGDKRSWRGTAVLMAKEGTINMNSETVGLGNAYDKMVDHSMRLTWSGMYAHAAPWNARYFGNANRSSGCIGMSDADAAWFYGQVRPGDPFEISGEDTKGVVAPGNGFGAWNLSWTEWQGLSALR
ncbi:Ig-like domain-containing protein [Streptomyces caniscabiei]|uniref:L,D-transpeptidase n=1 Tax=Streptomyces caniscabiei TaxID=2746961 RepID=UPI0029AB6247|nr:Ig-like domain-containing protein [Streptomyces caniscabiei]MDX2602101.1 Ig-like domain-containing protein [Streptomyces caniscabiei]MDX2737537.1 Ig-like domain-containing protein [Streptomyces caniscabiei]MDX2784586.1 Ig-like domain-containing protein [Streptomyces caniscabiei]